ncbi:MAG: 23S rRNA (adenine(2503)-C(2))-methyltransferase RlmN [Candidatus Latescibacterota bacterium]|nr:MAG: 23S rRNA (adenine(2503)-C(2))-methyltransferase RlmN [Candidatus Latescibacterota bacterium]
MQDDMSGRTHHNAHHGIVENGRTHLRDLSLTELREFVERLEEPRYRYRQLVSWLYEKLADDFLEMTDLPMSLRETLGRNAEVSSLRGATMQVSKIDDTRKYLFELRDGKFVESVMMRHGHRLTLCISSQVGCPMDCRFCQTSKGVFQRNLKSGEILDQICHLKQDCRDDADKVNIVFMGMGEPLLNYRSLVQVIGTLNDADGLEMGSKRITVSTSGLPRRMKNLANEGIKCSLAVSLNATTDDQRRRLMPAVSRHSLKDTIDAARYFAERTGRRVTLEYVLLKGENTSYEDAHRLGKISRKGPFKINLIPYNPGRDPEFDTLSEDELDRFIQVLLPYSPTLTVRRSKGPDIFAACGQLWNQSLGHKKEPAEGT